MALPLPALFLGALFTMVGGLILQIVAVATHDWTIIVIDVPDLVKIHFGLFKQCGNERLGICVDLVPEPNAIDVVRAMAIIGIIVGGLTVLLAGLIGVLKLLSKPVRMLHLMACFTACLLAGVLVLVGAIVYGAKVYKQYKDNVTDTADLGYSFGLSIGGSSLFIIGGCLTLAGGRTFASGEYSNLLGR